MFNNQDTRDFIHEHLTVKPVIAKVSRKEFLEFIDNYPRDLIRRPHVMVGMVNVQWFDARLVGYEVVADVERYVYNRRADSCLIVKNHQEVYDEIQRLLSERSAHHDSAGH